MKKIKVLVLTMSTIAFISIFTVIIYSCSNEKKDLNSIGNEITELARIENNQIIGREHNGEFIFTVEKDSLLNYFAKLAAEQKLGDIKYTSIEINKNIIEGSDPVEYYYGLYATDISKYYKSAIELSLADNIFRLDSGGGSITCTGQNCDGPACFPIKETAHSDPRVKYWTCTSCSNVCTKTMTINLP